MESGLYKKYISKSDPFDKEFENLQKIVKLELKVISGKQFVPGEGLSPLDK